ncbi:MAG: flagellar basal body L-ring protein FlgH [Aquabacterium sp.]
MKIKSGLMAAVLLALAGAVHADGSMFDEKSYQALAADKKAFKVGDALTVLVQEAASASASVDAKSSRSQDIGLRGQTLGQDARGLSGGTTSSNDGGGQVARSGRVTAQITVTVTELQPNGEMLVSGQQTVDLNGEAQIIAVAGRVRPRDISDANSVLSSRLADARITYSGQGHMAEKSQPSIWARLVTWIGL